MREKLLVWAGFEWAQVLGSINQWRWFAPDAEGRHTWDVEYPVPDFTSDLNACFKWLVPKLSAWGVDITISDRMAPPSTYTKFSLVCSAHDAICHETTWTAKLCIGPNEKEFCRNAKSPALALCKAIEQLIDKENK